MFNFRVFVMSYEVFKNPNKFRTAINLKPHRWCKQIQSTVNEQIPFLWVNVRMLFESHSEIMWRFLYWNVGLNATLALICPCYTSAFFIRIVFHVCWRRHCKLDFKNTRTEDRTVLPTITVWHLKAILNTLWLWHRWLNSEAFQMWTQHSCSDLRDLTSFYS